MELPIALETALKALLSFHSVSSWKITAEGPNPTVILRLRPENQPSACESVRVDSCSFRRKTPSQLYRDRRRAEEFRQRRDFNDNTTVVESSVASQSENAIEHNLNTEIVEETPSGNQNKKGDSSVGVHSSSATDTTETTDSRAACSEADKETRIGREADTETLTRDAGSDMETDNNNGTDTTDTEHEDEQSTIETARNLVENAKDIHYMPDNLRKEDRNITFRKVVFDWRCRETPKLLCISSDVIATCKIKTGEINFELRDLDSIHLSFWHFWPEVDQECGPHKETIDKIRIEMKEVLSRVRKLI